MPREVQVSKALSKLLRHSAEKEGLQLDAAGYINLKDVVGLIHAVAFLSLKTSYMLACLTNRATFFFFFFSPSYITSISFQVLTATLLS